MEPTEANQRAKAPQSPLSVENTGVVPNVDSDPKDPARVNVEPLKGILESVDQPQTAARTAAASVSAFPSPDNYIPLELDELMSVYCQCTHRFSSHLNRGGVCQIPGCSCCSFLPQRILSYHNALEEYGPLWDMREVDPDEDRTSEEGEGEGEADSLGGGEEEEKRIRAERSRIYGSPYRNFEATGLAWTGILRAHFDMDIPVIPPYLVPLMMAMIKIARAANPLGATHHDTYLDARHYCTLAEETANDERAD